MNSTKSSKKTGELIVEEFEPFPDLPKKETLKIFKKEYIVLSIILLLFVAFLSLGVFIYSKYYSPNTNIFTNIKQSFKAPEFSSERAQTYDFTHQPVNTKPQPHKVIIDPIDPKSGETMKIEVYISNSTPIISATAMLETENNSFEKPLTLSNGDDKSGVWTTDWKIKEIYKNTLQINLTISDDTETYEGGIKII